MLKAHDYEINWLFDFDNIDDLIAKLNEVKEKHKDAVKVYIDCEWTGYEDVIYQVVYELEETEEEKQCRIRIENERMLMQREKEKAAQRRREHLELLDKKRKELKDLEYDLKYRL
jgi:hypothetical protein